MKSWAYVREYTLRRDDYTCQTCFKEAEDVHHIIPKRLGGLNILDNLTSVCTDCHGLLEFRKYGYVACESTVLVTAFQCNRCGHVWLNKDRSNEPPLCCAGCKSPGWNRTKK